MNATTPQQLQPGRWCKVWLGAFTGSPGQPQPGDDYLICEVLSVNSIGQLYVAPQFNSDLDDICLRSPKYVFASQVLGPWPHECGRPHPQPRCLCGACMTKRSETKREADKRQAEAEERLAAAAPDLLKACEAFVADPDDLRARRAAYAMAKAAIAKAKGGAA